MDALDSAPLGLSLAVLALIDGLSIGTLLIPVFLLLAPRLRGGRVLLYLVTIAGFYLIVGVLVMLGIVNLVGVAQQVLSSTPGLVVRLVVGVALVILAFAMPSGKEKRVRASAAEPVTTPAATAPPDASAVAHDLEANRRAPGTATAPVPAATQAPSAPGAAAAPRSGRITRWRERLLSDRASAATVMAVAVAAGLVEVATMLPYLVAMGMLAETDLAAPVRFAALAAYCALMIAPALVLLGLRIVAAPLVTGPLERLAAWLQRTASETTAWIVGIVGFLVARSAAGELGLADIVIDLSLG